MGRVSIVHSMLESLSQTSYRVLKRSTALKMTIFCVNFYDFILHVDISKGTISGERFRKQLTIKIMVSYFQEIVVACSEDQKRFND